MARPPFPPARNDPKENVQPQVEDRMQQTRFKLAVISLLTFTSILVSSLMAQLSTGKIEGIVRDKDTGQPLSGAQVQIEGTRLGNITNADGYYFILNVPPGHRSITFTFTGYQK